MNLIKAGYHIMIYFAVIDGNINKYELEEIIKFLKANIKGEFNSEELYKEIIKYLNSENLENEFNECVEFFSRNGDNNSKKVMLSFISNLIQADGAINTQELKKFLYVCEKWGFNYNDFIKTVDFKNNTIDSKNNKLSDLLENIKLIFNQSKKIIIFLFLTILILFIIFKLINSPYISYIISTIIKLSISILLIYVGIKLENKFGIILCFIMGIFFVASVITFFNDVIETYNISKLFNNNIEIIKTNLKIKNIPEIEDALNKLLAIKTNKYYTSYFENKFDDFIYNHDLLRYLLDIINYEKKPDLKSLEKNYNTFVSIFPTSPYRNEYYLFLKKQKEINDFNKLIKIKDYNTFIDMLKYFKANYPNSTYLEKLENKKIELAKEVEKNHYLSLLEINNYDEFLEKYNNFKKKYPKSQYLDALENKLEKLNIKKLKELQNVYE